MTKFLKDPFRQLCLTDEIVLVARGEICALVPKATVKRIHVIIVATWLFDFENRCAQVEGTEVVA